MRRAAIVAALALGGLAPLAITWWAAAPFLAWALTLIGLGLLVGEPLLRRPAAWALGLFGAMVGLGILSAPLGGSAGAFVMLSFLAPSVATLAFCIWAPDRRARGWAIGTFAATGAVLLLASGTLDSAENEWVFFVGFAILATPLGRALWLATGAPSRDKTPAPA